MKQILKVSLLVIALLIGVNVHAQVKVGIKAGGNISNLVGENGEEEDLEARVGYEAGLTFDFDLDENISIQSGLMVAVKGWKFEAKEGDYKITANANPMYLQVPIHAAYKIDLGDATKVVLHAGPYVAYGIGGKISYKFKNIPQEIRDDFKDTNYFGSEESGRAQEFDYGVGGGVGVEFGKIFLDLNFDYGLGNVYREDEDKLENMSSCLSLGYKF